MNDVANIETARQRKDRERLSAKDRWTGREALVAALADIDSGELDPDAVVVIYAQPGPDDTIRVGRYCGSVSERGKRETFWIWGMIQRGLSAWIAGD